MLRFRPVPGAMGTQESGLGEWRVYTGAAVRYAGEGLASAKAAAEADEPEWYRLLKGKGTIEAHGTDMLWLDWMYVKPEYRGTGLGAEAYRLWEKDLPGDVRLVKLMAADTGDGTSAPFWEKMGYTYVYDYETGDYEADHTMWKGVNGHPTPPSRGRDEGDCDECGGSGYVPSARPPAKDVCDECKGTGRKES